MIDREKRPALKKKTKTKKRKWHIEKQSFRQTFHCRIYWSKFSISTPIRVAFQYKTKLCSYFLVDTNLSAIFRKHYSETRVTKSKFDIKL